MDNDNICFWFNLGQMLTGGTSALSAKKTMSTRVSRSQDHVVPIRGPTLSRDDVFLRREVSHFTISEKKAAYSLDPRFSSSFGTSLA